MTPLEILEAHTVKRPWSEASRMRCKCGEVVTAETEGQLYALHRAHVAEVIDVWAQEQRAEAKADSLEEAADEITRLNHDVEMYDENLDATPVNVWLQRRAAQYRKGTP